MAKDEVTQLFERSGPAMLAAVLREIDGQGTGLPARAERARPVWPDRPERPLQFATPTQT